MSSRARSRAEARAAAARAPPLACKVSKSRSQCYTETVQEVFWSLGTAARAVARPRAPFGDSVRGDLCVIKIPVSAQCNWLQPRSCHAQRRHRPSWRLVASSVRALSVRKWSAHDGHRLLANKSSEHDVGTRRGGHSLASRGTSSHQAPTRET